MKAVQKTVQPSKPLSRVAWCAWCRQPLRTTWSTVAVLPSPQQTLVTAGSARESTLPREALQLLRVGRVVAAGKVGFLTQQLLSANSTGPPSGPPSYFD